MTSEFKYNDAICAAPWTHIYLHPDGEMWPCCTAHKLPYGNTNDDNFLSVWNSDAAKKFRKDLLNGIKQECCEFCYNQEKHAGHSLRTRLNEDYGKYITKNLEPSLDNIKYIDIRSSNICNMACVMCNPYFSSKWHEDYKKLYKDTSSFPKKFVNINDDVKDTVLDILNDELDTVYFAGGEPLITPFHYEMLQKLIETGYSKNIELRYNTNLSTLKYKNIDIFDMWKNFKSVILQVSIDAIGEYAEYIRYGQSWDTILNNWLEVKSRMPDILIGPQITITSLNVGYLPELLNELINNMKFDMHWIPRPSWINFNLSIGPDKTCCKNLPENVKNQYIKKLEKFYEETMHKELCSSIINASIQFLKEPGEEKHFKSLIWWLDNLDSLRGNDWKSLWPEIENEIKNEKI